MFMRNSRSRHRRSAGSRRPSRTDARALHLIDVDNLLGDPGTVDAATIGHVLDSYRAASSYREGDHVVIATGCNASHVLAIELAWPTAAHRRRPGPDGADMALLEESDWAAESRRFDRVVIGSGDRIFLAALDRLRAADVSVDFVSRRTALADAVALRARGCVRLLPDAS
jgi:hypothetical protein